MVASDRQATGGRTDYLTIAQIAISVLGLGLSLLSAGGLAVLGLILLFGEVVDRASVNLVFSTAWISLLVAVLAVPSICFSIQRLRGMDFSPRLPSGGLRLATLLLLVWPLILLLGNLISGDDSLAWLLLPPLQLLAVGIPTWWLIELARHKLYSGSRQRGWGLINFSVFITTPAMMVVEIIVFLVLLIGFAVWASTQPAVLETLESLAERMADSPTDPDSVMRLLAPYLQNPWLILGILSVTSVLVPFIEEFFKPLAIWLFAGRQLTPAEGFVAGVLCGAGFALVESLFYLSNPVGDGWALLAAGRAGTILLHITTTALVGWAMASAWRDGNYLRLGLSYLLAVGLHGLWNGLAVLSGLAVATENTPAYMRFLGDAAPFGIAALGLLLIVFLWWNNRRLQSNPNVPPLSPGSAGVDHLEPAA